MPSVIEMAKEIDGENENRIAKQKLVKMLFADVTDSDIHYDDKGIMLINKPCEPKDIVKKENIQDVNSLKIINDFIPKKIGIEKLISSSGECVLEFD